MINVILGLVAVLITLIGLIFTILPAKNADCEAPAEASTIRDENCRR